MNITICRKINFVPCLSPFSSAIKNKNDLPQYKKFNDWIAINPTISVIINDGYCSLEQLDKKIIDASQMATHYLYLSINKFYVYSTVDSDTDSNLDHDSKVIEHCYNLIKNQFDLLESSVRLDDRGQLGNFIHPVTTMLLQRNDKTKN